MGNMIHCLICKRPSDGEPDDGEHKKKVKSEAALNHEIIKNLEEEMSMSRDSSEILQIENGPEILDKKVNIEDFIIVRVLGRGSFGKVLLVEKKDSSSCFFNFLFKMLHGKKCSMR